MSVKKFGQLSKIVVIVDCRHASRVPKSLDSKS